MSQHAIDLARLQHLLKSAQENVRDAEKQSSETQLDLSKERTQFFEKLAIGCGATIAAIVSFVGTHAGKLHPVWIFRCALISLAIGLVSAMYRNFRYPYYVLAARHRILTEAMQYQQRCKNDLFQVDRNAIGIQTGKPIDLRQWTVDFSQSDAGLVELIKEQKQREQGIYSQVQRAEQLCLMFIGVAMIALVWLALCNF